MMRYEWMPRLSVNNEAIDRQRMAMIRLMNDLHFAMLQGKGREKVVKLLDDLRTISADHFSFEESYLAEIEYPYLRWHRDRHAEFLQKMTSFILQTESNSIGLSIDVMNYLRDWLLNHIGVEDKKYADFQAAQLPTQEHA